MKGKVTIAVPRAKRYFSKKELLERKTVAFNIGDADQLAQDFKRGDWFFEVEADAFRGPYPTKRAALHAWKSAGKERS